MSSRTTDGAVAPNAFRLLLAGFMAILAAGIGFAIRGGILGAWSKQYGFTGAELGTIGGSGLTGFCFGIIIGGVIADKIGYGKLVIAAFLFHVLSAVVTFLAPDARLGDTDVALKASAFSFLYWGTFIFALANGTLEAVANPLVATLYPNNRTHYLNILHASWPAGLVLGGVCGWVLGEQYNVYWKDQLALFLIPTLLYGLMFLGQSMPRSEASKQGLSFGEMYRDVGILGSLIVCFLLALFAADIVKPLLTTPPAETATAEEIQKAADKATELSRYIGYGIGGALLVLVTILTRFSIGSFLLFVLFLAHALVGAVELGTDGWMQNITGNLLTTSEGRILFVFASTIMFILRFCSDFIERKLGLSPISILLACSVFACVGLLLSSQMETFGFALLAIGIYGVGKTFFWPTMLAVASDRFPRTGAVAISIMGGIGMLSAGLIGSPGLGYAKDRFSGEALRDKNPALFTAEEYKAGKASEFLFLGEAYGINPAKLDAIQEKNKKALEEPGKKGPINLIPVSFLFNVTGFEPEKKEPADEAAPAPQLTQEERDVLNASITGDRRTLIADAAIPATMAVIYLGLLLYFMAIGGYKPKTLDGHGGH